MWVFAVSLWHPAAALSCTAQEWASQRYLSIVLNSFPLPSQAWETRVLWFLYWQPLLLSSCSPPPFPPPPHLSPLILNNFKTWFKNLDFSLYEEIVLPHKIVNNFAPLYSDLHVRWLFSFWQSFLLFLSKTIQMERRKLREKSQIFLL